VEHVVEVVRGAVVESRHRIHAVVVDAEGRRRAWAGDPELLTYFRSAAKPFQALPLVADGAIDRFGLTLEELAVCCGSHSGQPAHVEAAAAILRKVGMEGAALACGPHPPFHEDSRRELAEAGLEPVRLHNNCSGKHAGMIALARAHGWDVEGYEQPEHPVQQRILAELSRWLEMPPEAMALGTDGCGAVTVGVPLHQMAYAYARLAAAARVGEREPTYVVGAMTSYPEMVAGDGRLCTELMRHTGGRVFAKVGAEGMYCVGIPGAEIGIALKVEDGATRAVGPAVLGILGELDLISDDDLGSLNDHAYPDLVNTRGEVVGQLRPRLELRTPDA